MGNTLEKIEGLYATIKSAYYLKNNNKLVAFNAKQYAYQYLKQYIEKIKSDTDIIIYDDDNCEVIINTLDKKLDLDRYVYIDENIVNLSNLSANIK